MCVVFCLRGVSYCVCVLCAVLCVKKRGCMVFADWVHGFRIVIDCVHPFARGQIGTLRTSLSVLRTGVEDASRGLFIAKLADFLSPPYISREHLAETVKSKTAHSDYKH